MCFIKDAPGSDNQKVFQIPNFFFVLLRISCSIFGKIAILADLLRSSGTPFPWCLFFRMYFFNGVFPDLPGEGL
jgi:hypothetical protein